MLGFELRLACPEGYEPDPQLLAAAAKRTPDHADPVARRRRSQGADVVNTDVWASMGQEAEQELRATAFTGFMVDEALMAHAAPTAIFLHCLPAHRGEEVTRGGDRRAAVARVGRGREPAARAEGDDGDAHGRGVNGGQ